MSKEKILIVGQGQTGKSTVLAQAQKESVQVIVVPEEKKSDLEKYRSRFNEWKKVSDSHYSRLMREAGINSFDELIVEYDKINKKSSSLSRAKRDLVEVVYIGIRSQK